MEKAKIGSKRQGALASFIAVLVSFILSWLLIITISPTDAPQGFPISALGVLLAAFFIPLLWWRNRAGFIGAIGIGVFGLIGWVGFTLPSVISGRIPPQVAPFVIVGTIFSLSLIYFSVMAWREKPAG